MSVPSEVEVLLATFAGERFLREQIDSILAQDYENLRVLARDDGSSDGTVEILREYEERFPARFRLMPPGPPTGSAKDNFLLLLGASTAEHVCFSDQDDVWLPDKVSGTKQAMDRLESRWGADLPLLVFTDLRVVDDRLRTLQESFWKYEQLDPGRIDRFAGLLGQNVVTGCTAMLNRRLVDLSLRMPEDAVMHDQWIALLASALGRTSAIRRQTVLYRQHDRNVVGSEQRTGSLPEFVERVRKTDVRLINWSMSQRQARAFLRVHSTEIPMKTRETILAYLACGTDRPRLARVYGVIRHGFLRDGLLRKLSMIVDLWMMKIGEDESG